MKYFIVSFLIFVCSSVYSQQLFDKLYFGVNPVLSGDANQFIVGATPFGAYKITDRLSAGLGITYRYVSVNQVQGSNISFQQWGGFAFSRFVVFRGVYAALKYELLPNAIVINRGTPEDRGKLYSSFGLGVGYAVPLGRVASFSVDVYYNFAYKDRVDYPYSNPLILDYGFNFGF